VNEAQDPVVADDGTVIGVAKIGFIFAVTVLPTIIFVSLLTAMLYHLGVLTLVVHALAWLMHKTMGTSGAETLSTAANIFVGQTEAPLVVRPFLPTATRSELMAIMVGGFANTAGGVLGAYVLMLVGFFPNIASHLIAASVLSAPAAFIFAKVLVPEKDVPLTKGEVRMEVEIEDANIIDAASNGTTIGWQLAINVGAMLVSFVALVALLNLMVSWFGGFFRAPSGVVVFDLMAAAAFAGLFWVERREAPDDTSLWALFVVVVGGWVGLRMLGQPSLARIVALVGLAGWLPLFLQSGRPRKFGRLGWGFVVVIAVAANLAYLVFGPLAEGTQLSLQLLLGWLHWPIALVMGVPPQDCLAVGKILGNKLILTEFVAYLDLSNLLAAGARGEVPLLDPRSIVIVSYALCGFANVASIGIQIGGIAPLAPSRRHDVARLGLKAMVGGALATFMIACVAGMFYRPGMLGVVGR
jgi:CNT family concentrative nucleoside transporter